MREVTYAVMETDDTTKHGQMVAVLGAPSRKHAILRAFRKGIMPFAGNHLYAIPESKLNKIEMEIAEGLCEWVKCPDCGDTMRRWELNITNHCAHGA